MKAHFSLLLLLVTGLLPLYSQDWAPFVPGQVSYYQVVGSDSLVVRREVMAHYDRGTHTTLYFHDGFSDSCTAEDLNHSWINTHGSWFADSMQVYSDFYRYSTKHLSYTFYHNLPIGQSFTIPYRYDPSYPPPYEDSLRITLDSMGIISVFGKPDSAKYFSVAMKKNGQTIAHPLTGETLILTKQFGFHRMISDIGFPGDIPLPPVDWSWNRISLSNDTILSTLYLPHYTEWIALEPGDILKWYATTVEPDLSTAGWWYRDSITTIHPEDSIFSYQYDRHRYKIQTGEYFHDSNMTQTFHRKALASNMKSNGNYLYKPYTNLNFDPNLNPEALFLHQYSIVRNDTLIGFSEVNNGLFQSDPLNGDCGIDRMHDYDAYTVYNYKLGITYRGLYIMYGTNTQELVGYRLGGQATGNTFPLAVPKQVDRQLLSLSPNPASSYVHLDLPPSALQQGQLALTDLTGRVVLRKQLQGNATVTLSSLPAGLYLVEVKADGHAWHGKIIKE